MENDVWRALIGDALNRMSEGMKQQQAELKESLASAER